MLKLLHINDYIKINKNIVTKESLFKTKKSLLSTLCKYSIKEGYRHRLCKDSKSNTYIFKYENKDKIIGCCMLRLIKKPKTKNNKSFILTLLCVEPEYRRQGIGTQIFNMIIDLFKKKYKKEIIIYTHSLYNKKLFYEYLGFVKTCEIINELYNYEEIEEEDIIMKFSTNKKN